MSKHATASTAMIDDAQIAALGAHARHPAAFPVQPQGLLTGLAGLAAREFAHADHPRPRRIIRKLKLATFLSRPQCSGHFGPVPVRRAPVPVGTFRN